MKRPWFVLALVAPAALLLAAGSLLAQERARVVAPPDVGRFQLVEQGGKARSLIVFDTATGAVYGIDAGRVHSVQDPIRGVCRFEPARWPEREALAQQVAQALLGGNLDGLLPFLPEKRQAQLRHDPDARQKFEQELGAVRVKLGKDVAEATRLLLRHEADDLEFNAAEARWLLDW